MLIILTSIIYIILYIIHFFKNKTFLFWDIFTGLLTLLISFGHFLLIIYIILAMI